MANPTQHVIIDISTSTSETAPRVNGVEDFGGGGSGRLRVSRQNSNGSNSRLNRGDSSSRGGRGRSPLNSGFWISLQFIFTLSQIVASFVVLSSSRYEHPQAPLFAWIVGYAIGCIVSLPLLVWRYYYTREQYLSQNNSTIDDPSGTLLSNSTTIQGEDDVHVVVAASSRTNQVSWVMNQRLKILVEYIKIIVDLFFAIWFVIGNVWIFGGPSSANEAPNLYRLCVVFLTLSCIGYAMPFILCLTICCCLPCIISALGVTEDVTQTRGATSETINALPTYKFKTTRSKNEDESSPTTIEGGIVAEGTEKERMISGEDAVCCICILNYENEDELRELPCSHLFHKECVDKWLKINALCPLCKSDVAGDPTRVVSEENSTQQRGDSRVENSNVNTSSL
ncbi:E3 ubiquitin-protein ligase At1g63170-like [Trifolium pratense]|uniref:E3 ubiquitin-protein ligase At1g63170-like n=1 Tax=Trifolium pratense TaxID=57577 RepID=UPI001E691EE7|nr:E3 ubiquitin-protein ligase At1g63170-like [Trifolium pratense]